jgi:hypothetical protein
MPLIHRTARVACVTLAEWVKYPLCKWEFDDQSVDASATMASAFLGRASSEAITIPKE